MYHKDRRWTRERMARFMFQKYLASGRLAGLSTTSLK